MIAKLLLYLGVMGLSGGAAVRHLLSAVRLRWLLLGFVTLLVAAATSVGQTLAAIDALNLADAQHYLLDIAAGRSVLWMLLGATLLLASEISQFSQLTTLGAAGLTLWGLAGIGHGATHGPFVHLLHTAHAAAMTLWVAGVLSLLVQPSAEAARRFSPWALGCLVTLALTGAVMALNHAGNLLALPQSDYGRTLLLKSGVYLLTPVAAVLVRRALFTDDGARPFLAMELLLLLIILGLTARLTGLEPPGHMVH